MPLDFTVGVERTLGRPKDPQEIIERQRKMERIDALREMGGYGLSYDYNKPSQISKYKDEIYRKEEEAKKEAKKGLDESVGHVRELKHLQYITKEYARLLVEDVIAGNLKTGKFGRVMIDVDPETTHWRLRASTGQYLQQRKIRNFTTDVVRRAINEMIAKMDAQIERGNKIWSS